MFLALLDPEIGPRYGFWRDVTIVGHAARSDRMAGGFRVSAEGSVSPLAQALKSLRIHWARRRIKQIQFFKILTMLRRGGVIDSSLSKMILVGVHLLGVQLAQIHLEHLASDAAVVGGVFVGAEVDVTGTRSKKLSCPIGTGEDWLPVLVLGPLLVATFVVHLILVVVRVEAFVEDRLGGV
jgi:hypothetical protein